MEVNLNKKKTIKIIVIILILALLVVGGVFGTKVVRENTVIKETEQKLGEIDATELEDKLIKTFENTNINIQEKNYYASFGKAEDMTKMLRDDSIRKDMLQDFIVAAVLVDDSGDYGLVIVPLFKVESDSNGKVKNIIYADERSTDNYEFGEMVANTVEKFLKDNYDIDIMIRGNTKYNTTYNSKANNETRKAMEINKNLAIYGTSNSMIEKVMNNMTKSNGYIGTRLKVNIFGLDIQ